LKNSVFEADEKILAPQTKKMFFDMRGVSITVENSLGAPDTVRCKNGTGFVMQLVFSRKAVPLRFRVFQQI